MKEKFAKGLKGTLFEPGYVTGPKDPGQLYMFWRIIRLFAALQHVFPYKMLITPIDMLIDNYWIALENPGKGPQIICPFIKDAFHLNKLIQKIAPNTKLIEFENFRQLVQQVVPKRAKYFGPNMLNCLDGLDKKYEAVLHPLYDYSKYQIMSQIDYLLTCESFSEALQLGKQDSSNFMKIRQQQKN